MCNIFIWKKLFWMLFISFGICVFLEVFVNFLKGLRLIGNDCYWLVCLLINDMFGWNKVVMGFFLIL